MKNKLRSAQKFVSDHRVALTAATTTALFVALQMRNAKELNAFLKEHNLLDEFYAMSEEI